MFHADWRRFVKDRRLRGFFGIGYDGFVSGDFVSRGFTQIIKRPQITRIFWNWVRWFCFGGFYGILRDLGSLRFADFFDSCAILKDAGWVLFRRILWDFKGFGLASLRRFFLIAALF